MRAAQYKSALLLLPQVDESASALVASMADQFLGSLTVVLPSGLDALDMAELQAIRRTAFAVTVYSPRPGKQHIAHYTAAVCAATGYELSAIAIPIHFQNLCDRIKNRYGLAVRDREVLSCLGSNPTAEEVAPGVFRSRYRYRSGAPREYFGLWAGLLRDRVFQSAYDLDQYCHLLDRWYPPQPDLAPPPITANTGAGRGWLQIQGEQTTQIIRLEGTKAETRLVLGPSAPFWAPALLENLLRDSMATLDAQDLHRIGKLGRIRKRLTATLDDDGAASILWEYAELWIGYVEDARLRGQEQKWRGWYLVPEHGPLTVVKLQELRRLAAEIRKISNGAPVLVDRSDRGLANVSALLDGAGIVYRRGYPAFERRDLFIRQQKNYLERLGLIAEIEPGFLSLTDEGLAWADNVKVEQLVAAFRAILTRIRWSWCNMPYFVFARDLAARMDGYLTFTELFNWVIHAYDRRQIDDLSRLLVVYRSLGVRRQRAIDARISMALRDSLAVHVNASAFGHYRTKIRDLMTAFATTGDFDVKEAPDLRLVRRIPK